MIANATSDEPDENGTVEILPDEHGKMNCPYCNHPMFEPDHTNNLKCRICGTLFEAVDQ